MGDNGLSALPPGFSVQQQLRPGGSRYGVAVVYYDSVYLIGITSHSSLHLSMGLPASECLGRNWDSVGISPTLLHNNLLP